MFLMKAHLSVPAFQWGKNPKPKANNKIEHKSASQQ